MSAPELKPVEGKVVLKFLDEESDEERDKRLDSYSNAPPDSDKGLWAQVLAAGAKCPCKKGDVVLVSSWARDSGIDLGDDSVLTDAYCVLAVLGKS